MDILPPSMTKSAPPTSLIICVIVLNYNFTITLCDVYKLTKTQTEIIT